MATHGNELPEGTVVGEWRITSSKPLGRGGQGAVWSVKPTTTRRAPPRALKASFSEHADDRARFVREIELLRKCDTPFVPKVFAADTTWSARVDRVAPFAYYVTEKYDGALDVRAADYHDARDRLAFFRDACTAVTYLHSLPEPIVHRDIKPANFLVTKEHRRLVLGDFGIARELVASLLTKAHEVVGSELFRAPEVSRGDEGSVQSDVYSLGRVLEWLLTNDVSRTMGTRKVPRGTDLADDACDILDRVLMKSTAPHPSERFATVKELVDTLPDLWLTPRPVAVTSPVVDSDDVDLMWTTAIELARTNDLIRWRQQEHELRKITPDRIKKWRAKHERNFSTKKEEYFLVIDELVHAAAPRLVLALAGVYSRHEPVIDQRRLLEELTSIPEWNGGGATVMVEAPRGLVYLLHHLHGALACELGRNDLALQLLAAQVRTVDHRNEVGVLWRQPDLISWPAMFGGDVTWGWEYLFRLPEKFSILDRMFPLRRDYSVGLAAYSMLVAMLDFADSARDGNTRVSNPPLFWNLPREVIHAAYTRTFGHRATVQRVADDAGVRYEDLKRLWPEWKKGLETWRREISRGFFRPEEMLLGELG